MNDIGEAPGHKHNLLPTAHFKGEMVMFICICGTYCWVEPKNELKDLEVV